MHHQINLELVASQVMFEEDLTSEPGCYVPGAQIAVEVACDGETVTFTRPDGSRVYCERADLLAVVGKTRIGLPSASCGVSGGLTAQGVDPPGTRTEKNPPPARRRSPWKGIPPHPYRLMGAAVLTAAGGALLVPWPMS